MAIHRKMKRSALFCLLVISLLMWLLYHHLFGTPKFFPMMIALFEDLETK
jgi:hypothetical protein